MYYCVQMFCEPTLKVWPNYSLPWHCVNFRVEITATLLNHSSHDNCSDDEDGPQIPKHYKPVVCLGRQPSLEPYVLGPELQFYAIGRCVPVEDQDFIWIPEVLEKLLLHRLISHRIPCHKLQHHSPIF